MEMDSQRAEHYVMGIDGGGSKTTCVVLDHRKNVIGQGRGASCNRNSVGDETARANLTRTIQDALAAAGLPVTALSAVCAGIAGVDRPQERTIVTGWFNELCPGIPIHLHNDAVIALASGTGGELYGVAVVSGTGMIVYGIDRNGQTRRAGGWGPLFADKGSGYALGAAALAAIAQAVDGLGPATALEGSLLDYLDLSMPQALIPWAYSDRAWARIAELGPLVVECARQNDAVALAIIEEAAVDLAAAVEHVVRNLNLLNETITIVLAGGNLLPGFFATLVSQHLHSLIPKAQLVRPSVEPAVGAALLVLNHLQKGQANGSSTPN
jgi:N-acetylglucosamine kinase-like BadF-type ATPase